MTSTRRRGGARAADHGIWPADTRPCARGLRPRLPPLAQRWSSLEAGGRQIVVATMPEVAEMAEHATAASRRQCCRRERWLAGAAAAAVGGGRPRSIHHNSLHTTNLMHDLVAAAGAWLQPPD